MERTNMLIKSLNFGAIVAAAIVAVCASSHSANAVTVTYTQNYADYTDSTLPTSSFNPAPVSSINTFLLTGSPGYIAATDTILPDHSLSPFANTHFTGVGDWANLAYTSVEANGSATYNFGPADKLKILWGSPDSYNTLSFYSGLNGTGMLLFSITGSSLGIQNHGHDEVDFSMTDGTFESVVLASSGDGFEFADLQDDPAATPLPAALPLFATGLGAMGLFGWRRKRKAAAAA
jgi:hypothetical protein